MPEYTTTIVMLATYKYAKLADRFVNQCAKNQIDFNETQFIICTDVPFTTEHPNVEFTHIDHEPWPNITRKKFQRVVENKDKIKGKYVMVMDADTSVKAPKFDLRVFHQTIFVLEHPLNRLPNARKIHIESCENRRESMAYVDGLHSPIKYVCGCCFGGLRDKMFAMCEELYKNTETDFSKGIKPKWDDESHVNAYANKYRPNIINLNLFTDIFNISDKDDVPLQYETK